jgi:phage-related baseplate assembly protein
MADKPQFINTDPQAVLDELIADYEARTGRTLLPSQAERLLINSFAYMLSLHKSQIQDAALQNLVAFATAPALDRLGDLVGVTRLTATSAITTIEFVLVDGHGGVTVPAGTRIASIDNEVIFQTDTDLAVTAGINIAEVSASAQNEGADANGLPPAGLVNILDPQAFIASASNITTTAGGADAENDAQLRERIILAPSAFSTAGSKESYIFHAKSASALIADVAITNPVPGTVGVYPMIFGGGTTPAEILGLVEDALTDERVRPLTDTVVVLSPTTVFYAIEVDLTLYTTAIQAETVAEVEANLETFKEAKGLKLGIDIMISQIVAQCTKVAGVYDVAVTSPASDTIITPIQVAICTGVTVNVIGTNEG